MEGDRYQEATRRLLSLLTLRRVWGPATMLLGLLQQGARAGWLSLDALGRLDVLWRIVESTGGEEVITSACPE
jgi:hypothetical protein